MKDHLLFRNQRKVKRKTEQHQIEALYEDAPTHIMIEEPDFDRMEAISLVDEDHSKISSTQMHRRRRDEE